jgi:hypothetical protein
MVTAEAILQEREGAALRHCDPERNEGQANQGATAASIASSPSLALGVAMTAPTAFVRMP